MKLQPFHPFEPVSEEVLPSGEEWISQIKWDGVRILTYFDGTETKLFNRKLNERTAIFPEFLDTQKYSNAESVILDGEVIALDHLGKPSFHEVMRRDGIRRHDRVNIAKNEVPVYYMVFDVVFHNGKWVNEYPLSERLDLLSKIIKENKQVQVVPSQQDHSALFEVCKNHNLEGIVCKNLNSRYLINGKNDSWRKIKNYKDIIAVIGGVTYRGNVVNSMLLGLYDQNHNFCFIGLVGTGKLTRAEWMEFSKIIEPLKTNERPFINQPDRLKNVQWLKPIITVKVQYIEWPEGHSLRQPSIQAFVEYSPDKCTIPDNKER